VSWHRTHIGHLAGYPLRDHRVEVHMADVMDVLKAKPGSYDVILMDTDNGPDTTIRTANIDIYSDAGLRAVKRSLKPGGIASFWSATISASFEEKLSALPWNWRRDDVQLIDGRADAFHYIYFASEDDTL